MRLTLRLVVQGPMADEFDGISYCADLDLLVADTATALSDLYAGLLSGLPADPTRRSLASRSPPRPLAIAAQRRFTDVLACGATWIYAGADYCGKGAACPCFGRAFRSAP